MFFLEPKFWHTNGWCSRVLAPAAFTYELLGKWYYNRIKAEKISIPVICVGNLVMGGAGKTPTVIAIVEILKEMGHTPHILSRGYGAIIKESVLVDREKHNYLQVGDEALLLAEKAPTWAGRNRLLSAKKAIASGATVIVMDDGLQNNTIRKDFSILVVDTMQGFGNGKVFPAGPLRESARSGIKKADLVLAIGDEQLPACVPNYSIRARIKAISRVDPQPVVAFAGLGYPEKFKKTLTEYGYEVKKFIPFPDHHPYTIPDLDKLVKMAKRRKISLVTTAKDMLRVPEKFRQHISVLHVCLDIDELDIFKEHIIKKVPCLLQRKGTDQENYSQSATKVR